jgi:hypothetical protein
MFGADELRLQCKTISYGLFMAWALKRALQDGEAQNSAQKNENSNTHTLTDCLPRVFVPVVISRSL